MNKKYLMMFTAAAILMAGVTSVSAQPLPPVDGAPAPHHEKMEMRKAKRMPPDPEKMAEKLADELGLSEAQREQAKAINKKGMEEVKPLMDQMRDIRKKMDELRKENMKEFESILTPEQKTKFDAFKEKMHPKHRAPRPRHKAPKPVVEHHVEK